MQPMGRIRRLLLGCVLERSQSRHKNLNLEGETLGKRRRVGRGRSREAAKESYMREAVQFICRKLIRG
jgi:hypothetical protein